MCVCVCMHARVHACVLVRAWPGGTIREPGLAASVFTHSRRFPAAHIMMHLLALGEDSEAKFNSYGAC